jgi:hypothetical protein
MPFTNKSISKNPVSLSEGLLWRACRRRMSMKHISDKASINLRYTQGDKHDNQLVNIEVF